MYCKNCGKPMNDNQAICLNCGVNAGCGNKFCANCGEPVNENAAVCTHCGVAIKKIAQPQCHRWIRQYNKLNTSMALQ